MRHDGQEYGTVREACRVHGLGERPLRGAIARGEVPIYRPPRSWPLVRFADVERWLRSNVVRPTPHAEARVREILEREDAAG